MPTDRQRAELAADKALFGYVSPPEMRERFVEAILTAVHEERDRCLRMIRELEHAIAEGRES